MKCLICGNECEKGLCDECCTEQNFLVLFRYFSENNTEIGQYPYIDSYVNEQWEGKKYKAAGILLDLFDALNIGDDYYLCRIYALTYDSRFEESAIEYLDAHTDFDDKKQFVFYDLIEHYNKKKDFDKPEALCDGVYSIDGLSSELYYCMAVYYSRVGEYDKAEMIIQKALDGIESGKIDSLRSNIKGQRESLEKLRGTIGRYRTLKPYWPNDDYSRKKLTIIYDRKNIDPPKPKKVKESEFVPITEEYDPPSSYVAFWCRDVFNTKERDICEIGALKVQNGEVKEEFHIYVKPWKSRIDDIKKLNLDEELEHARPVHVAYAKFMDFVNDHTLVSLGAFDAQSKLLTRAARYSGVKQITNGFFDVLDYADEVLESGEMFTVESLLGRYGLEPSINAMDMARNNVKVFERIRSEDNG